MSGNARKSGAIKPVIRSTRRRKGGKAQPVIVVSGNTRLESGASQPVYVVDADYVAAHGLISGAAQPVQEVTGKAEKGGRAKPVYVVSGSFDGGGGPTPPPAAWYQVDGITPLAAYQAKGAASYAASKVNLGSGGAPYNLSEGNGAVPWASGTGWSFAIANSQYFDTGIVANTTSFTVMVQFANGTLAGNAALLGAFDSVNVREISMWPHVDYVANVHRWDYGGDRDNRVSPHLSAGNMCLSGFEAYLNGVSNASLSGGLAPGENFYLGSNNHDGVATNYVGADIIAAIIHSATYTPAQVATLAAQMAAL